jgi:hypothetical protein
VSAFSERQKRACGRRSSSAYAFAEFSCRRAPERFQLNVFVSQFVDRHFEERTCSAWREMRADDRSVLPGINNKASTLRTRNNRPGESFATMRLCRVINSNCVFVEVDDQFDCPAGHNPLLAVRGSVAEKPEALDEIIREGGPECTKCNACVLQTDRGFGPIQTLVNGFLLTARGEPNDRI